MRLCASWGARTLSVLSKVVVWVLRWNSGTWWVSHTHTSFFAYAQSLMQEMVSNRSPSLEVNWLLSSVIWRLRLYRVGEWLKVGFWLSFQCSFYSPHYLPILMVPWQTFVRKAAILGWRPMRFLPGNDLGSRVKLVQYIALAGIPLCQPPTPPSEIWP